MKQSILKPKRVLIAIFGLVSCCGLLWYCARIGYARTLAKVAAITGNSPTADLAVTLSPADAETHFARGQALQQSQQYDAVTNELTRAVQLRPRDYYLWLELGLARDQNQDQEGALRAFRQAVDLAPFYANGHWKLGNLLLRMGRLEQGFTELRKAASSNPTLLTNLANLAWGVYGSDTSAAEAAVAPHSDAERMALAIVYAKHGANQAAINQFMISSAPASEAETLLELFMQSRAFTEAYSVWARLHGAPSNLADALGTMRDGSFEGPMLVGDQGFGWEIAAAANVRLSVDESNPQSGAKSLRIDFRGNSEPQTAILKQLVLVKADSRYRLRFFARAQQVISAALPVVTVADASSQAVTILGQSSAISSDLSDWREFVIEFTTGSQTSAVTVSVRRQSCPDEPCPAFGAVWLDSFRIESPEMPGNKKD